MKKILTISLLLIPQSFYLLKKKQLKTTNPFAGLDTAFQRVLKDKKQSALQ